jgi:Protein of unknown function (DUF2408)
MDESSVYNESDLAPFRRRLNDLHSIIKSDSESGKHSQAMTKLLERQLGDCGAPPTSLYFSLLVASNLACAESVLGRLHDNLSVLSAELVPVHERLVTVRRKLVALAAKGGSPKAELKPLQEELRKIDSLSIIPNFAAEIQICSCSILARMDVLSIVFLV